MDFKQLSGLISAHAEARIVHVAVELGLFDRLAEKPSNANELSLQLHIEAAATELLLNALAALQLVTKSSDIFSLTESAQKYLVSKSPTSLCGMIHFESSRWNEWGRLAESIRSGRPARSPNMYQDDAHETATFIEAMDSLVKARGDAEILARAIDWHGVESLLDIGSGPATYPIYLCRQFPDLCATIFDLPGTLEITKRFIRQAAMDQRIELIAGDYRCDAIPGSYDAIFLSNIIHGENSEKNAALISKLTSALKAHGRIIIKDHILNNSRANPPVGAIFSLLMLLTTDGGRCYSLGEIKSWMERAGLNHVEQIDLPPPLTSSLVIGQRD